MRNLIVVTYPTEMQASEERLKFLKMQKEYLVDLEDAVVVTRKQDGKVKLHQMYNLTASGALNDTLTATITASFGKDLDGNPYKASATLAVSVRSAETLQDELAALGVRL